MKIQMEHDRLIIISENVAEDVYLENFKQSKIQIEHTQHAFYMGLSVHKPAQLFIIKN